MGWWEDAGHAAAYEFGRRHWRWFAAAGVGRRALPAVAVVSGAGVAAWALWRYARWEATTAFVPVGLLLLAALLVWLVLRWAWPRWGWMLTLRPALTAAWCAAVVVLLTGVGLTVWLVR